MPGEAQNSHSRHLTARRIIAVLFCALFLIAPETAHANVVVASSGFKNMLAFCASLPVFAAICAYLMTTWQKNTSLRVQQYIFFLFAFPPALCFYVLIGIDIPTLSMRKIQEALTLSIFLSFIWFSFNFIVYGIYSHIRGLPRPFLFRWVTRKRLLLIFTPIFILAATYVYYPKAYFYYHLAQGNAGDAESQLWLGKAYETPWVRKPFGDRGQYTERDYFKARDWYEKAAVQNNADAYVELAELYGGMKPGFISHDSVREAWQKEVDLETARYWAQKAAESGRRPDLLIYIEKLTAQKTPAHRNFIEYIGSPVIASGIWLNIFSTICWLIGSGLLNTAVFFFVFKLYKKLIPKSHLTYKIAYCAGILWPLIIATVYYVMENLFARKAHWGIDETLMIGATFTTAFLISQTSFMKLPVVKEGTERTKLRIAYIYAASGIFIGLIPFATNYLSGPIVSDYR